MKKNVYQIVNDMDKDGKVQFTANVGLMMLWFVEGQSIAYIAEKCGLHPRCIKSREDDMLLILRNQVGRWRYFKMLFTR